MRTHAEQPQFMNAQALAVHLGVTERTVRRWIERGELPAKRQGRAFVIRREDGERLRLGALSEVVDDRSSLERLVVTRDRELATLEGRYAELQERVRQLEQELDVERRHAVRLQFELETTAGQSASARAA